MKHTTLDSVLAAVLGLAIVPASAAPVSPQTQTTPAPAASPAGASSQKAEEISSRDVETTFRRNVNLVMVPVVVRDAKGNAIGNLRREDFRLFDNGKPQAIKHFSIETPATRASVGTQADTANAAQARPADAVAIPRRFVAYVFDDRHMDQTQLVVARTAAEKQLSAAQPGERVAVYTTSGQTMLEFTDDIASARAALMRISVQLRPRPCPDLGPHWAELLKRTSLDGVVSRMMQTSDLGQRVSLLDDYPVLKEAYVELDSCPGAPTASGEADTSSSAPGAGSAGGSSSTSEQRAQGREAGARLQYLKRAIDEILMESSADAQASLALLDNVVRRMAALPGEKSIVTVSPGFLTSDQEQQMARVIDHAVQNRVVVNTLDSRGVYTNPVFDASDNVEHAATPGTRKALYKMEEASLQAGVLEELADGTGGVFFHSNNDLNEGFHRTAGLADSTYLLGFTPTDAPRNGKGEPDFHKLKVTLDGKLRNVSIQARRGYFVARTPADPAEAARQQIEAALFSSDEINEIPIQLRASFFKRTYKDATLNVSVRVDLKQLPLRKVDGRNCDDLHVYAAIFDRNGNYVTGKGKVLELRLRDETLAELAGSANIKTDFDLTSGNYLLRVVVRDKEGPLMAAASKPVQIP